MSRAAITSLTASVGLSALLLFGVEPLIGQLVVPYFGGAAHVWLTCLMFFQAVLFLGYLYAHLIGWRLGVFHLVVLALPLLTLPIHVEPVVAPDRPLLALVLLLLRTVGLPFFALSTTAVVLQSWLARSHLGEIREPYPLYAASNVGSLVALLSYPVLVEPFLPLSVQRLVWSGGYVGYALLIGLSWYLVRPDPRAVVQAPTTAAPDVRPGAGDFAWWLLLAALPSSFLLATTNLIASEIGSIPLVWVVPLALYLGTFIWTFREGGGVPRLLGLAWPEAALISLVAYFLGPVSMALTAALLVGLTLLSTVAHGELYARRPHPRYLT